MICQLFYLPVPSVPLSHTVHLSQSKFWQAHKLILAKKSEKQTSLESFLERGKDAMMRWQKALLYCQQKESAIWKKMLSPLNKPNKHYGFIATGDLAFSKPVLYNM